MSTPAVISPSPIQKFWDNNGNPLAGGTVATYAAGTTTPIATYVDYTATTTNTNPITLNFRGECNIWLLPNISYKFVVSDSLGNLISSTDQIQGVPVTSFYGGVDTGSANAYVLTFAANFAALTNGIFLTFIAANANTGASTLSVNGLGVQAIITPGGSALDANQILASHPIEVLYYNGSWIMINREPQGNANLVFATPDGVAGVATLRALVTGDLPSTGIDVRLYKAALQTVTSSNTPAQDTDLTTVSLPVGVYYFELLLNFSSNNVSNGGIFIGLKQNGAYLTNGSTLSTVAGNYFINNSSGFFQILSGSTGITKFSTATISYGSPTAVYDNLYMHGTFSVSTPGSLQLWWSQDNSSSGNLIMSAGSYLAVKGVTSA